MSLTSSINNALSGLTVSSRAADIVSSNIANAMTEGYGVRSLEIGARIGGQGGAGAQVIAVLRDADPVLASQRRMADADLGHAATHAQFTRTVEGLIGTPEDPSSLPGRLAEFEARLVTAANSPHNQVSLSSAVDAAVRLAETFRGTSSGIQKARLEADRAIGQAVTVVNDSLRNIADLNDRIRAVSGRSGDYASLVDAQTKLIDKLSPIVPVQTRRDAAGALQIYSLGGERLLEREPAILEFRTTAAIEPGMLYGASILSGLRIDGREIAFDGASPPLGGGRLAAHFAQRDNWGPDAQMALDAVARDLAERFDDAGFDPTLLPGDAGLFTDAGARTDPAAEAGLSARLEVAAAVRPEDGGAVWRLRDGLNAANEGARGDASLIVAQIDALSDARVTQSGGFSASPRSMAELVSDHVSHTGIARQGAEARETGRSTIQRALHAEEQARGVDTDAEMQSLLRIEQMYAANARVLNAVETMLDELMRIAQ